jgi:acyl-coenzyme A synthetase/AMP-(fatty) acid ligase
MSTGDSGKAYPLLRHHHAAAIAAYRDGEPVDAARFLADVRALAGRLPSRTHVVNRCAGRYRFAAGFAAALLRGQITLLPPNDTPEIMRQLAAHYPDIYCLTDEPVADTAMEQVLYPQEQAAVETAFAVPSFDADRIAALIFTSGSTGQPTPHAKRWGTLVQSAMRAGERLGVSRLPGAAVIATVSPQHSYGLESSVMLPFQHGLALTSSQAFYPSDIVHALEAVPRPRILITTPIHLRFLMADSTRLPETDLMVSATAPLTPQMAAEAEARFKGPLIEIYGCAEAGQTALRRTAKDEDWECLDGISLSQDAQGTWADGELLPRRTLLSDVIDLRSPLRFTLQGRTADLVNIAGKRTSLAHLNFHLNAIPGVKDGVFVIPEETGERMTRLAAFVVAPTLQAQDVISALRERIDPVFLPRPLRFVDALPRNATGKLTRKDVQRLLAATATQAAPERVEIVFAEDAASAAGHFPGNPIIPGAVLLQEVLCALQNGTERFAETCEIRTGKFLHPVRPGDRMEIHFAATGNGDIRFDCSVREQPVLTGVIATAAPAS